ncbi:hypothetical protein COO60DRAFT_758342 [Scenedesmus sp. NREL 46B-D3]|nr:hypothetical protein COO60DRAFT_758342 [Scenedesmus sp. NREL 46B-D3]
MNLWTGVCSLAASIAVATAVTGCPWISCLRSLVLQTRVKGLNTASNSDECRDACACLSGYSQLVNHPTVNVSKTPIARCTVMTASFGWGLIGQLFKLRCMVHILCLLAIPFEV